MSQNKSQEEIAYKRLQAKLKRDMSADIRELIANLEMIQENNKEIDGKLRSEKENFDKLLNEKTNAEEDLELREKELEQDTKTVEEQEALLRDLKAAIEKEQAEVDAVSARVEEAKKVNKTEEERNRHLQQTYTAFAAKKEFIEAKYDYTGHANDLNLDIFKKVMETNMEVNDTVNTFMGKVTDVKNDVTKILNSRF